MRCIRYDVDTNAVEQRALQVRHCRAYDNEGGGNLCGMLSQANLGQPVTNHAWRIVEMHGTRERLGFHVFTALPRLPVLRESRCGGMSLPA